MQTLSKDELIAFEQEVIDLFEQKKILCPIHLSGGNEDELIEVFGDVRKGDWVFATYRSHYHALLHGIPREEVLKAIVDGHSMNLCFPHRQFFSSAIVAGSVPIAVGVAAGIKRHGKPNHVWCFIGDMASRTGIFNEAYQYVAGHSLPITFVIEDNGMSCDSPTLACWGKDDYQDFLWKYQYERKWPHVGIGKHIAF